MTALIAVPSFLLVALVLYQDRHDALAYATYAFSAYGLAVTLTWAFRSLKDAIRNAPWFRRFLDLSPVHRYLTDVRFRTRLSLLFNKT